MSRLTNKAPDFVVINGEQYPINTNFRDCLNTSIALSKPKEILSDDEKIEILLWNAYDDYVILPDMVTEFASAALDFLQMGKSRSKAVNEKLCDFEIDGEAIYAAFLKTKINLDKMDDMHWWEFMSRFSELPESSYTRRVYLRSQKNKGKLSKEERAECGRIGWDIIDMIQADESTQQADESIFKD